jgi:hypothetical protein
VEQRLAELASRNHGVVTRRELLGDGVSAKEIDRRLGIGALIAVFRGVYRVGHTAPSVDAHYLAAVRACGDGALLSGRAAGHLLGLLRGPPPPPEVTAPAKRRIEGVRTARARRQGAIWRGVPVTSVAETLVDLAAVLNAEELARACHEAGVRHHTTLRQVEAVLARRPTTRGAAKLRRVLRGDVNVTLSTLERAFLALLRNEGLPYRRQTSGPVPAASTAAGPTANSPSSSTAIATTTPATPGNKTAAANAKPTRAAMTSDAIPTATSSKVRRSCSPSSERCSGPCRRLLPLFGDAQALVEADRAYRAFVALAGAHVPPDRQR